jgi:hypothetical protein
MWASPAVISRHPFQYTKCTHVSRRRSFSEESTLELVTPVLDLDTFWVGREGVCDHQSEHPHNRSMQNSPSSTGAAGSGLAAADLAVDLSALALVAFAFGFGLSSSSSSTSTLWYISSVLGIPRFRSPSIPSYSLHDYVPPIPPYPAETPQHSPERSLPFSCSCPRAHRPG